MTTNLKAKLLQHFAVKKIAGKKANGGFTLIELLVVIIIIGILSAIALPSFLNQANKARQSEAKTYIGSMNRAQQAHYLENNAFTDEIASLGLGIAASTENYSYDIDSTSGISVGVTNRAITWDGTAVDTDSSLKAYIGGVKIGSVAGTNEATTLAILCEANAAPINGGDDADTAVAADLATAGAVPACGGNFKPIN